MGCRGTFVALAAAMLALVGGTSCTPGTAPGSNDEAVTEVDGRGAAIVAATTDLRLDACERVLVPPPPAPPAPAAAEVPIRREPTPTAVAACVEVRVTQDQQPLAGAVVHVWHGADDQCAVARGILPPTQSAVTDRDGVARLDVFAPRCAVLAAESGRARVQRRVRGTPDSTGRHELEFGTSTLTGTVHDAEGAPRRGACVLAYDAAAYAAGRDIDPFVAIVGVDGSFQMSGLPALSLAVGCDVDDGANVRRYVTTAPERRAHVRFGRTPGAHCWRGRVVDAQGQVVPGHQRLVFLDREGGERRELYAAVDGSFAAMLPSGLWDAKVGWSSDGRELPFGASARLDAVDHTGDLVLPGLRVLCRLIPSTPTTFVRFAEFAVFLHRGDARLCTRPPFSWNGEYWLQWVGLEPDAYTLRSVRGAVVSVLGLENGRSLALHPGSPVLQLDLTVR